MYLLLIGFLLIFFIFVSFFALSNYLINSRESYTGSQFSKEGDFISVGGVNTHYIRKGRGNPLLLIHGIFSSSFVWHRNINTLSRNFDVIAIDLKGYGYSDKPADGKYSQKDIREFLIHFMDALRINKAVLIGHSWGGGIAMDLALSCPERFEKLVLIDSTGYKLKFSSLKWLLKIHCLGQFVLTFFDEKAVGRILKHWVFFNPSLVTGEELQGWINPYYVKGATLAALEIRKINFNMEDRIKYLSHPTLIIWGKEDKFLNVEISKKFERDIKNSILKIIEDCGHNPQEEKPEEVNKIISEFILSH